jgi:hypothetical protein
MRTQTKYRDKNDNTFNNNKEKFYNCRNCNKQFKNM